MPTFELTEANLVDGKITLIDCLVLSGLTTSKTEARKLIQGNGVAVNDAKVTDIALAFTAEELKQGVKIKKGKKVFEKIILK